MLVAINPGRRPSDALESADWLRAALSDLGVSADVHAGQGIALISVWIDLVVWTDGTIYYWWSGEQSPANGRRLYSYGPADDPVTVARRVAQRLDSLSESHPLSAFIHEAAPTEDAGVPL
jgi:hypothetical protein